MESGLSQLVEECAHRMSPGVCGNRAAGDLRLQGQEFTGSLTAARQVWGKVQALCLWAGVVHVVASWPGLG